jgi:subtilisin-like proprotein convertase family protein
MHTRHATCAAIATLAAVCTARAEVFTGTGGAVTDNSATPTRFTLRVNDSLVVGDLSLTLTNFKHSSIGDLVVTLTHQPSGLTMSIMDQIGRTTTASGNRGDASDFQGTYTFADGGSNLWAAAAALNSGGKVADGTYAATGSGIGSSAATGPASLSFASTFGGMDARGDWVLAITDRGNGHVLNSDWTWSIGINAVPAPGALALLSVAGVTALGRRRKA